MTQYTPIDRTGLWGPGVQESDSGRAGIVDHGAIMESVAAVLSEDSSLPRYDELEDLILYLRGHLAVLIPAIEDRARLLPKGDGVRCLALAGVGEAQRKLGVGQGVGLVSAMRHAQQLARSCRALVHHHEQLALAGVADAESVVRRVPMRAH